MRRKKTVEKLVGSKSLIVENEPFSMVSESYKMFRTNLSYMNVDKENKVLLFTSSQAGEGKTTTISNTAISFAKAGYKTLIVECDLRRARIHEVFSVPKQPGLTNILTQKIAVAEAVHRISSIDKLDIITAGPLPPAPAELLDSKSFELFIREARDNYDMILIDAPPILNVTDAAIISRVVDGVILVIAYNESKKDGIIQAKKMLDKVGAPIIGSIITKIEFKKGSSYYYNYGNYYGDDK